MANLANPAKRTRFFLALTFLCATLGACAREGLTPSTDNPSPSALGKAAVQSQTSGESCTVPPVFLPWVKEGPGRTPTAAEVAHLKGLISDKYLPTFGSENPAIWPEEALLLAMVEGFKVTHDTWFIEKQFAHFDRLLATRDDKLGRKDTYHHRVMKAWGTKKYSPYTAWVVHTGLLLEPIAEMVRIVLGSPELQCTTYGQRALQYLPELEASAKEFLGTDWYDHNAKSGYLHFPKGFPATSGFTTSNEPLPYNQMLAFGGFLAELYAISGNAEYKDRVVRLIGYFRVYAHLIPISEHTFVARWPYWVKNMPKVEDTPHGSYVANFAAITARILPPGPGFNASELRALTYTFTLEIADESIYFSRYIDGTGGLDPKGVPERTCGGYLDLDQWNHKILGICRAVRIHRGLYTALSYARELKWEKP